MFDPTDVEQCGGFDIERYNGVGWPSERRRVEMVALFDAVWRRLVFDLLCSIGQPFPAWYVQSKSSGQKLVPDQRSVHGQRP